jgi:hypothetical protein
VTSICIPHIDFDDDFDDDGDNDDDGDDYIDDDDLLHTPTDIHTSSVAKAACILHQHATTASRLRPFALILHACMYICNLARSSVSVALCISVLLVFGVCVSLYIVVKNV